MWMTNKLEAKPGCAWAWAWHSVESHLQLSQVSGIHGTARGGSNETLGWPCGQSDDEKGNIDNYSSCPLTVVIDVDIGLQGDRNTQTAGPIDPIRSLSHYLMIAYSQSRLEKNHLCCTKMSDLTKIKTSVLYWQ